MQHQDSKKRKWDIPGPNAALVSPLTAAQNTAAAAAANMASLAAFQMTANTKGIGTASYLSAATSASRPAMDQDAINRAKEAAAAVLSKIQQESLLRGSGSSAAAAPKATDLTRNVYINDVAPAIRFQLTKRSTQDDIQRRTRTIIVTRGRYYPPGTPRSDNEQPLHLYVTPGTAAGQSDAEKIRALDDAVEEVQRLIQGKAPKQIFMGTGPTDGFGGSAPQIVPPAVVYVALDCAPPEFNVPERVKGKGDQFLQHIANTTRATIQLRGRGSVTMEGPDPLHLFITGSSATAVEEAKKLAQDLLETVRKDFRSMYPHLAHLVPPPAGTPSPYAPNPAMAPQHNPHPGGYPPPGYVPQAPVSYPPPGYQPPVAAPTPYSIPAGAPPYYPSPQSMQAPAPMQGYPPPGSMPVPYGTPAPQNTPNPVPYYSPQMAPQMGTAQAPSQPPQVNSSSASVPAQYFPPSTPTTNPTPSTAAYPASYPPVSYPPPGTSASVQFATQAPPGAPAHHYYPPPAAQYPPQGYNAPAPSASASAYYPPPGATTMAQGLQYTQAPGSQQWGAQPYGAVSTPPGGGELREGFTHAGTPPATSTPGEVEQKPAKRVFREARETPPGAAALQPTGPANPYAQYGALPPGIPKPEDTAAAAAVAATAPQSAGIPLYNGAANGNMLGSDTAGAVITTAVTGLAGLVDYDADE